MHKIRSGESGARLPVGLLAAVGLSLAAVGIAIAVTGGSDAPATDRRDEAAPTEQLALETTDCEAMVAAAGDVVRAGHIGHEASIALEELRRELPPPLHEDIDVIVGAYRSLDAGETELLLDDAVARDITEAGAAVSDYLADTCGIDWSES